MSLSKRDTVVKFLDPLKTLWRDAEGGVHFSPHMACLAVGLEPTMENMDLVIERFKKANPQLQYRTRNQPDSPEFHTQKLPDE